ncbi:hypothetical protein [Cystobacter fuscus]|nr:hypothetical protein [Cystobacter fuscus]
MFAASYEARRSGVRSAMLAVTAERLCPHAIFGPLDFTRDRAVAHACRELCLRHTDRIEPLSLDEACLANPETSSASSGSPPTGGSRMG